MALLATVLDPAGSCVASTYFHKWTDGVCIYRCKAQVVMECCECTPPGHPGDAPGVHYRQQEAPYAQIYSWYRTLTALVRFGHEYAAAGCQRTTRISTYQHPQPLAWFSCTIMQLRLLALCTDFLYIKHTEPWSTRYKCPQLRTVPPEARGGPSIHHPGATAGFTVLR